MPGMIDPKKDPSRPTRQQVLAMKKAGVSAYRIAVALDISPTRVHAIVAALKKEGKL